MDNTSYNLLYVGEIILVLSSDTLHQPIMPKLYYKFGMKNLDPLKYFMGISITRH